MANFTIELEYTFTDVNGDTAQMRVRNVQPDTATIANLVTLANGLGAVIDPCTNAKNTRVGVGITVLEAQISAATAPPPASATYPSVTDGAKMTFDNSNGGRRVVVVPAPVLTDFITGTNTVNPADGNISALIAFIEGLADLPGTTNLYAGGVKVGRHARRRVTRKHL